MRFWHGAGLIPLRRAEAADFAARALSRAGQQLPGVTVLGPAPAPLAVLRGRHRRRFLVKTGREVRLQAVLRDWLFPRPRRARCVSRSTSDPYSFLWFSLPAGKIRK
jgi:primosomal protein N' (replication factor Y) (superfamily II helicase)